MGRTAKFILEPTSQQTQTVVDALLFSSDIVVKESRKDALVWCMKCGTERKVSLETAKQVKKAKICPFCFNEGKIHKGEYTKINEALIRIVDEGYYYRVEKKAGTKPKVYCKQVAYWIGRDLYARNIYMSMYQWCFRSDETIDKWYENKNDRAKRKEYRKRKTTGYNTLDSQFFPLEEARRYLPTVTKKHWLERQYLPDFKSNQKKIIIDTVLNRTQMWAVAIFDLKSVKQIYKYNAWINEQDWMDGKGRFNVYMLDYLYRNKIAYCDYLDYIDQCKELHIKPGKPRDFYKTHADLAKEIKIMHEKSRDEEIKERLKDFTVYKKGQTVIRPLKDVEDIVDTGAVLHNCIGTYVDIYAKGRTDLYVLEVRGEKKVAIEVKNKELKQARGDYNRKIEPKHSRIINEWMKVAYA